VYSVSKIMHIGDINFTFKLVYVNALRFVIIMIDMFIILLKKKDSHVTLLRFGVVKKYAE
jgi:uncharacterized membrane protein